MEYVAGQTGARPGLSARVCFGNDAGFYEEGLSRSLLVIALAFAAAFVCKWLGTSAQSAFEAHVQSPLWRSVLGYYGVMIILGTVSVL